VNAIAPGATATPGTDGQEELLAQLVSGIPARRVAQATEIVGAAVYLARAMKPAMFMGSPSPLMGEELPFKWDGREKPFNVLFQKWGSSLTQRLQMLHLVSKEEQKS
jgi:NAD(P)-dependent dehydrogenase (short-subunit alcohol dehydrogenase family)